MLSVFLNLDPAQFATPAARSSAITSVMTAATHKVEESDGISHDERMALRRDDVERVREVLMGSDIAAQRHPRRGRLRRSRSEDLLEVVRLRRPVENKVVLDRTPFVEPLVMQGTDERWMVLLANRRAARLFFGTGDALEETDRLVDDVHQQHHQGRLVAVQLPALGRQGGLRPPPERCRPCLRPSTRRRARTACWWACRASSTPSSRASCTRT